jgi:hypothetical protein
MLTSFAVPLGSSLFLRLMGSRGWVPGLSASAHVQPSTALVCDVLAPS